MRIITCKAIFVGVELPESPIKSTCKACPVFHIKGMCNTGCGNAAEHVPHKQEHDLPLWGWAVQTIPEIADPAARIV